MPVIDFRSREMHTSMRLYGNDASGWIPISAENKAKRSAICVKGMGKSLLPNVIAAPVMLIPGEISTGEQKVTVTGRGASGDPGAYTP